MLPKPAIEQRKHDSKPHACNIRNPILHIRAAPKRGLYNLYKAAEYTCSYKDRNEPKAARARQRKGECCEGNKVHHFIASSGRWGRLIDWPKHGHSQNSCDNQCERDIEILSHVNRVSALGTEHKEKLRFD